MTIQIKPAKTMKEKLIAAEMTTYAFAPSPVMISEDRKKFLETTEDEIFLIWKGNEVVTTGTIVPLDQNVRGKVIPMGGVAGVATNPEHRNKGYVTALMEHLLSKMLKNSQYVSALYPFRESFYRKFGYVNLPQIQEVEVNPRNIKTKDIQLPKGIIYSRDRLVDVLEQYYDYKSNLVETLYGAAKFNRSRYDHYTFKDYWALSIRDEYNKTIAWVNYKMTGFEGEMKVRELTFLNEVGRYAILKWMEAHKDQVLSIKFQTSRKEQVESWLPDLKAQSKTRDWVPSPMARIIDVRGLNGIEATNGSVILEIEDEWIENNNSTWKFEGKDGRLSVTPSNEKGQKLNIRALTEIIYSRYNFERFRLMGWSKLDEKTEMTISNMFTPIDVDINESF